MAIDRLNARLDRHEEQLGDHLRRLTIQEAETERTRDRLHRMEADRRATQLLVRTTQKLADQTSALAAQVVAGAGQAEHLAERAAEHAVQKAFERRSAGHWKIILRLSTVAAGFGALGYLIAVLAHGG